MLGLHLLADRHLEGGDAAGDRRRMHVFHLHRLQRDQRLSERDLVADAGQQGHHTPVHRGAQAPVARRRVAPRYSSARTVLEPVRTAAAMQPQTGAVAGKMHAVHHAVEGEAGVALAQGDRLQSVGLACRGEREALRAVLRDGHRACQSVEIEGQRQRESMRQRVRGSRRPSLGLVQQPGPNQRGP